MKATNRPMAGSSASGHHASSTLGSVLIELEAQIGVNLTRIVADAGYRGHNASDKHRLKVFTSGQKRGVSDQIKRELRRRAAVEPVIAHLKAEHRMDRNCLAGRTGDAINAVLAGAGYNFRLLIIWRRLLSKILAAFLAAYRPPSALAYA